MFGPERLLVAGGGVYSGDLAMNGRVIIKMDLK
jgi:hypothetical protein